VLPQIGLPVEWSRPYGDNYVSHIPRESSWSRHSVSLFRILGLSASCLCWTWVISVRIIYYNACCLLPPVRVTCFVPLEERSTSLQQNM